EDARRLGGELVRTVVRHVTQQSRRRFFQQRQIPLDRTRRRPALERFVEAFLASQQARVERKKRGSRSVARSHLVSPPDCPIPPFGHGAIITASTLARRIRSPSRLALHGGSRKSSARTAAVPDARDRRG